MDDFLSLIGKSLIKKRRVLFEKALATQKELYLPDNTPSNYLVKWCEGLKTGHFEKEDIHFYSLDQYITPSEKFSLDNVFSHGMNQEFATLNDRYRLEFEPIIHTLSQYVSITERVSVSHPTLEIDPLNKTKDYIRDLDFLKMSYLGMQKMISKKLSGSTFVGEKEATRRSMDSKKLSDSVFVGEKEATRRSMDLKKLGDCAFVGEKEAKRRSMDLAFAHYDYFSKVVHPLMVAVKSEAIDLDQANSVLHDFHGSSEGGLDSIDMSLSGDPIFIVSRLTYMLRTRKFLISGVQFDSSHTTPFSLPPIVGSHLEIPIPLDFMNDSSNPYFVYL